MYGGGKNIFYQLSEELRDGKTDPYHPRLVSIGFFHGKIQLKGMEKYKFKYLNDFLENFGVTLERLTSHVVSEEKSVCDSYERAEPIKSGMSSYEIILLDGIFIIELFLKNYFPSLREKEDMIFSQTWISNDVKHDLLLLENQLPLQFLATLYQTFVSGKVIQSLGNVNPPSFYELVLEYFQDVGFRGNLLLNRDFGVVRHFTEILSILYTPSKYYQATTPAPDRRLFVRLEKMCRNAQLQQNW